MKGVSSQCYMTAYCTTCIWTVWRLLQVSQKVWKINLNLVLLKFKTAISVKCEVPVVSDGVTSTFLSDGKTSTIQFSCDKGYAMTGSRSAECQTDGQLNQQPPVCGKLWSGRIIDTPGRFMAFLQERQLKWHFHCFSVHPRGANPFCEK